jgi:hypothetical protein
MNSRCMLRQESPQRWSARLAVERLPSAAYFCVSTTRKVRVECRIADRAVD